MERDSKAQFVLKEQLDSVIDTERQAKKPLQETMEQLEKRLRAFEKQLSTLAEMQHDNKELLLDIRRLQEAKEFEFSCKIDHLRKANTSLSTKQMTPWEELPEIVKAYLDNSLHSGASASEKASGKGIPLCLPDNIDWDPLTGEIRKTKELRSILCPVPEAIEMLKKIKEPVCVVSIAGPCRQGKSYILEKVFDQKDVFSIGHEMDAKTMGIWMWILPEKFQDSNGRDFTVILLDSEGTNAVTAEGSSDNQIFTLTVLLASVLIYNSSGVPNRGDLKDLSFISKLSHRIRIRSKGGKDNQDLLHHDMFPFFIWLLRDVSQKLPGDCRDLNHYFETRVFKESQNITSDEKTHQMVTENFLKFFSGFEAVSLPAPSVDDEIMTNIGKSWDRLNPNFRDGVEKFAAFLKWKLSPKQSVNRGESITGEALGRLVQLYTAAINDPEAIPNVEAAWDTVVREKCSQAKKGALAVYDRHMTLMTRKGLPCDVNMILKNHVRAQRESVHAFEKETAELLSSRRENELSDLTLSIDERLNTWKTNNASETKRFCQDLLEKLKKQHLDPVLSELRCEGGARINHSDIIAAWDTIKKDFHSEAKGAKDAMTVVFFEFNERLQDEMRKYDNILRRMKDYDENIAKEKLALACREKENKRLKASVAQFRTEEAWQRKMTFCEEKQQKQVEELRREAQINKERMERNMQVMKEEDIKTRSQFQWRLDAASNRERKVKTSLQYLRREFQEEQERAKEQRLAFYRQKKKIEREALESQRQLQNQLSEYAERKERTKDAYQNLMRQREVDGTQLVSMRNHIESLEQRLAEANNPSFLGWLKKKIW